MSRRARIGHHQLEDLRQRLTETDWQILQHVADFRLLSGSQLQILHFGNEIKDARRARRRLQALVNEGVLDRLPRRVGGRCSGSDSTVFRVGRAGQRLNKQAGGSGPAWRPSAAFAAHTLAIGDLYVRLVDMQRSGELQLVGFTPEPQAWRTFFANMASVTLKPDAYLVIEHGGVEHHYFVEVDLGTESLPVIEKKLDRYIDYFNCGPDVAVFPQVLFLVDAAKSYHSAGTEQRVRQIRLAAERATEPELFVVEPLDWPPWGSLSIDVIGPS